MPSTMTVIMGGRSDVRRRPKPPPHPDPRWGREGWGCNAHLRTSRLILCLGRVLHVLDLVELDVVEMPVHLLHLTYVDVLHDVPGFRVDAHGPARALPAQVLHGLDQRVAGGVAAGLLERRADQMHAVVAADAHEVRAHAGIR